MPGEKEPEPTSEDEESTAAGEEERFSSDEGSEYDSEYDSDDVTYADNLWSDDENDESAETTVRKFNDVFNSRDYVKMLDKEEKEVVYHEDLFDFPKDPENWREEDLQELWADGPLEMTKIGWDPVWADDEDCDIVREEIKAGKDPPIAPFYVPFRRPYPAIPDDHFDISTPKSVIEELDRIEEFLTWVSYIFADGSSYEGTVWDDVAQGKGVYVADQGLLRYEGEWLRNNMEGHGVIEVDIPGREPIPGSKLEEKMRAEGKIIARDYMSPEDREWLEMDIEDHVLLAGGRYEIPWDESDEWIRLFGRKPEKGRYKYAGQWKHSRMHGCGVYEVNEKIIYGRFYFGELLEDSTGCDANVCALHAGIAEVAAAKARMFVNKPDGMIREARGPFTDPKHPYLYEEDDVWMAPGFINQFYEVPDYWKRYAKDVDQEREMWLNSFYKSPLRIPMPAELEYWWENDETPEFVLVNKEPEPDPEDPSKLIHTEDPLILHTRTGRLINYVDDDEYGVRLFWQPELKEGEDVDPEKAEFLPLGFDEFYGQTMQSPEESKLKKLVTAVENVLNPIFEKLKNWTEEQRKNSEIKLKMIEQELEFVEAQICLEEALEDLENDLKEKQKEEEKKAVMEQTGEDDLSNSSRQIDLNSDEEQDEEEQDEDAPTSFGSVSEGQGKQDSKKNDKEASKPAKSPFSACSLSFASPSVSSVLPSNLQESFVSWKKGKSWIPTPSSFYHSLEESSECNVGAPYLVKFQHSFNPCSLRAAKECPTRLRKKYEEFSQLHLLARVLSPSHSCSTLRKRPGKGRIPAVLKDRGPVQDWDDVLSIHNLA